MVKKKKEIIIPEEKAVFRMDKHGRWVNRHGPFQHKKIIDYFHRSIRKDEHGYFLYQTDGDISEKVYFRYEDTALFVFDIIFGETIELVLNTGQKAAFEPEKLFVKNDGLYMETGQDLIKFSERALLRLSGYLDFRNGRCFLNIGEEKIELPIKSS